MRTYSRFPRAAILAAVLCLAGAVRAETTLNVHTAVETEDLEKYAQRFNADHPEIRINWKRESTGVISARLLSEKDSPRADVIWGLAATSLLLMKEEGLLQPYAPKGLDKLDTRFRDSSDPPHWVGMDAWVAALCVNVVETKTKELPHPASWRELTNPVYRGELVMPDPGSSGTGFLAVSSWLQLFGEEEGWAFMDGLHRNISHYTHSGSRPCIQAARGEVSIGISFANRGARLKSTGSPLEIVLPREGIGWDMEAAAIVKGTDKLAAAKTLLDWSVSESANRMYNEGYAVIAIPELAAPVEYFPADVSGAMIKNDFEWAAGNRQRIVEEWRRRYAAKSEQVR